MSVLGDFSEIKAEDAIGYARLGTGLIPKGTLIDPLLAGVQGEYEAGSEYDRLTRTYGNLDSTASHSRGMRKKLQELRNRWKGRVGEAAASAGGAFAGAAGATMLLGPAGMIGGLVVGGGGMLAGGYAADKIYNRYNPRSEQDAVTLVARISEAQQQGETVPPEAVFAALAMSLPDHREKLIVDRLEQRTGTGKFDEALGEGKIQAIRQLMIEFDSDLRGDTRMPLDSDDPTRSVAEQYAELINSDRIDARKLLESDADLTAALASPPRRAALPDEDPVPPVTPFSGGNYRGRAA